VRAGRERVIPVDEHAAEVRATTLAM